MNAVAIPEPRARVLSCSVEEYHCDPGAVPTLSQSIAHTLVTKSPAHAWATHPRLGAAPREDTDATRDGTIIHQMLLGKGADVEIIRFPNFKKKAAQELRDAAVEAGRVPIIESRYQELVFAADAIRTNLANCGVVLDGESEVPVEWREQGFDGDVLCRGLLDHVKLENGVVYDVKKIVSADDRTCAMHCYTYGYDIQRAAYVSAVEKLAPQFAGRVDYQILFCELEAPYAVNPFRMDLEFIRMGEQRWHRAVALWERCLREDRWPPYSTGIREISPLPFHITQEDMINGSL
jgi:hypothetical protein